MLEVEKGCDLACLKVFVMVSVREDVVAHCLQMLRGEVRSVARKGAAMVGVMCDGTAVVSVCRQVYDGIV